jgi:hypothetical protein
MNRSGSDNRFSAETGGPTNIFSPGESNLSSKHRTAVDRGGRGGARAVAAESESARSAVREQNATIAA